MPSSSNAINSLTDETLYQRLCELFRPLKKAEINRALTLVMALVGEHHGVGELEELNWAGVSEDDKAFVMPVLLELNQLAIAMEGLSPTRKQTVIDKAKLAIYGGH